MTEPRCETCTFIEVEMSTAQQLIFEADKRPRHYFWFACRVNPPTIGLISEGESATVWPNVRPIVDWCGAYEHC